MSRAIVRLELAGPAGRIEGLLHRPREEPRFAATVAHPHPLHGGTMDNKVAYRVARGLEEAGGLVLRFNFRGVGRSEGRFDGGRGEADDLRAAVAALDREGGAGLSRVLAGFSFGSAVSSGVGAGLEGVSGLLLVGAPLLHHAFEELVGTSLDIAFVQGDRDEHGPLERLEALCRRIGPRATLRPIAGSDHFFTGALDELQSTVHDLALSGRLGVPPAAGA